MPRSPNAQIAVDMYDALVAQKNWTPATAWHGIAQLLLTCQIWVGRSWQPFHDVIVYRESNDFKIGARGPNATLRRAETLSAYLAQQLGVSRQALCQTVAEYWRNPLISPHQPHNLAGHAFRSLTVSILQRFGSPQIEYKEEVSPSPTFPGHVFSTRSEDAKLDIVAWKNGVIVALISSRWRFRHDRVDVVEEAIAYAPPARRQNANCRLYASVGEFAPNRLAKILINCPPAHRNSPLDATVHFAPQLISQGLQENGRLSHLKSLEWLINETFSW